MPTISLSLSPFFSMKSTSRVAALLRSSTAVASAYAIEGFEPNFLLDFKNSVYKVNGSDSTLANSVTHTRAGQATMTDSDGKIKWAPHNLLIRSEELDLWAQSGAGSVVVDNAVAPDGTTTAATLTFGYANFIKYIRSYGTYTLGDKITFSFWVRSDTVTTLPLGVNGGASTGNNSTFADVAVTNTWNLVEFEFTILQADVSLYYIIGSQATNPVDDQLGDVEIWHPHAYRSDLGGMVDNSATGDSYVPTTSSAVYLPRLGHHIHDYDELLNTGLLHEGEARTNLLTHSNDFTAPIWARDKVTVVSNYGVSPDGTSNADKVTPNSLTETHFLAKINQQVTPFNAWHSKHSFSVYVASAGYGYATVGLGNYYSDDYYMVVIDLSNGRKTATYSDFNASQAQSTGAHDDKACTIEAVGSYYRVTISGYDARYYFVGASPTPTYVPAEFGLNSFTGDNTSGILVYGAQFEKGTTPSSYIPTSGSQVTRAEDTLTTPAAKLPFFPIIHEEEMITNGTSLTDTTGWTLGNNATLSVQDGKLIVASGGGFSSHAYQDVSTVVGKSYKVSVDYESYFGGTYSQAYIRVSSPNSSNLATLSPTTNSGTHTREFTAVNTTTKIWLSSYYTRGSVSFNNISLKEIEYLDGVSFQMDGLVFNSPKKSPRNTLYNMVSDSGYGETISVAFTPYVFSDITNINRMTIRDATGSGSNARNYYPNINTPYDKLSPFSIATRNSNASMNSALDSELHSEMAQIRTEITKQSGDLRLGRGFIGSISKFRMWGQDIGDTGITKASKATPSHPVLMTVRVNAGEYFRAPTAHNGLYDAVIDWGDGTSSEITEHFNWWDSAYPDHHIHTYEVAGDYQITITGTWTKIDNYVNGDTANARRVLSVEQLGHTGLTDLTGAFRYCKYMTSFALGKSDTSKVEDFRRMFDDCENLTSLDIGNLDTSSMRRINNMFFDCRSLTSIDVSGWDTSRITDMSSVFTQCYTLASLDVSGWDTSSVTSFSQTFRYCHRLTTLDVSGWDTSNVRYFYEMFNYNYDLTTLDVSGWDTSSANGSSAFQSMFNYCNSLTSLDVSGWDTSGATSMYNMFSRCTSLTSLDVSNFDTSGVTDMGSMFYSCSSLTSLDVSSFDTSNVFNFTYMLRGLRNVTDIIGVENFNIQSVTSSSRFFYFMESTPLPTSRYDALLINWEAQAPISGVSILFGSSYQGTPKYTSGGAAEAARNSLINTYNWTISDAGIAPPASFDMTVRTTSANEAFTIPCYNLGTFNATVDWGDGSSSTVTTYNDSNLAHTYASAGDHAISISGTFPNIYFNNTGDKTKVISVTNLGQVGWQDLGRAFYGCSNMTSFTGGVTDTSSVTNMRDTFFNCGSLTTIDVSNFDTSSVTTMNSMFHNCSSLTTIDVSGFNTSNVRDMYAMFRNCPLTSLDVSSFNTSSVTSMEYTFSLCSNLTTLDVSNWDVSSVTNMAYMFYNCQSLTTLDVSNWNTSSVTKMRYTFAACESLTTLDVSNWNTSSATTMYAMVHRCDSITSLDVSNWDVSSVTNMGYVVSSCPGITSLDVSNWNTSSATDMNSMFRDMINLTTLNVTNFDTSSVTVMAWMFYNCQSLTTIDVSGWDTSSVTTMRNMFQSCFAVTSLDVSNWNTSSTTDMSTLFHKCNAITSLDVSNWDVSSVTNMNWVVSFCPGITSLDVSNWNTSSVTSMGAMFRDNENLTTLDVTNFDTSNVTDMNWMFYDCRSLTTLDVSNFDTSSVTTMRHMFDMNEAVWSGNAVNVDITGIENFNIEALNSTISLDSLMTGVTLPTSRYDALLINWDAQDPFDGMSTNFGNSQYTAGGTAAAARANLINTDGWTIQDGGTA